MKFNYMSHNGKILTSVTVNNITKKVKIQNYTDDITDRAFGIKTKVDYDDVICFFEHRCIPKERSDIQDILELMNLTKYDPYVICKFNKGTSAQDSNWIDFIKE